MEFNLDYRFSVAGLLTLTHSHTHAHTRAKTHALREGDGDMLMSLKSSNQPTSSLLNNCTITETRWEAQRATELLALYIQRRRGALTPFTPETHAAEDLRTVPQDWLRIAQHGQLSPARLSQTDLLVWIIWFTDC